MYKYKLVELKSSILQHDPTKVIHSSNDEQFLLCKGLNFA